MSDTTYGAPLVDLTGLRTFTGGDNGSERELLALFLQQADQYLLQMRDSRSEGKAKA
jgi:hypothetical protein